MKKAIDAGARTVTFTFDDGLAPVTVHADKLSPEMAAYAVLHSIGHRVGDNAALSRNVKANGVDTVRTVTEAMRRDAVIEMATHMESGSTEWDMRATARAPVQNSAILTVAAKLGLDYAEAEAFLANADIEALRGAMGK